MSVASWCCKSFCVVPCVSFCTGHFVMVPLNMTNLHCLQHSLLEHLFNLYFPFPIKINSDFLRHKTSAFCLFVIVTWFYNFSFFFNSLLPSIFKRPFSRVSESSVSSTSGSRGGRTRRAPPLTAADLWFFYAQTLNFLLFFLRSLRSRFISA